MSNSTLMTNPRYKDLPDPKYCRQCGNPMRVMSRTRVKISWTRCDRCHLAYFGGLGGWTRQYKWESLDQQMLDERIKAEEER